MIIIKSSELKVMNIYSIFVFLILDRVVIVKSNINSVSGDKSPTVGCKYFVFQHGTAATAITCL